MLYFGCHIDLFGGWSYILEGYFVEDPLKSLIFILFLVGCGRIAPEKSQPSMESHRQCKALEPVEFQVDAYRLSDGNHYYRCSGPDSLHSSSKGCVYPYKEASSKYLVINFDRYAIIEQGKESEAFSLMDSPACKEYRLDQDEISAIEQERVEFLCEKTNCN